MTYLETASDIVDALMSMSDEEEVMTGAPDVLVFDFEQSMDEMEEIQLLESLFEEEEVVPFIEETAPTVLVSESEYIRPDAMRLLKTLR